MNGLPQEVLGAIAQAFLGGWMAARVIHCPCPAVLVDIPGAYSWAYSDEELQRFQVAEEITVRGVTKEFQALSGIERQTILSGERPWARRLVLLRVRPHGREWLPTRPVLDGVARLTFAPTDLQGDATWWWLADVLGGVTWGGSWPTDIAEAIEFLAPEIQGGLRPVRTPFGRLVDLRNEDLATANREERARLSTDDSLEAWERKLAGGLSRMLGPTLCYGNPSRIDREQVGPKVVDQAIGPMGESLIVRNGHRDVPGPHFNLLVSGAVTARVRLAMATTIAHLEERQGSWLHAATDSLLIAATHDDEPRFVPCPGGFVRHRRNHGILALPIALIDEALAASGVPWRREAGFEEPMTAYVSRVNRFAMLDIHGNGPATESALGGVYADPTGRNRRTEDGHYAWAVEGHLAVARAGVAWDGKGPVPVLGLPEWGDYPAPRTGVANGWEQVQRLQDAFPDRRIRPFTPFFQAVVDPLYSIGVVPVTLDVDLPPGRRLEADWRDQRTGKRLRLTTGRPPAPGMVRVRTYREVLELWRLPDDPTTTPVEVVDHVLQPGLRAPIPVRSRTALFELTGKEGDDLLTQMVDPGAIKNGELTIYRHANTWEPVLERAKTLGATELARRTGLSERTARYVIQGRRPSPQTAALVSSALSGTEDPPPRVCGRAGCDARVSSRKRFCSDRCRRAAARARDRLMLHEVGAVRCRCGAIRYGSAKDPCPSCGGSGYVEVRARQCPGCGAQRVGDTTATCPACGRASA